MSDFFMFSNTLERVPTEDGLHGFRVEATDGHVGTVMESSDRPDESYVIVDTGHWLFSRKVVLPAGAITRIDEADRRLHVDLTRDEIKAAPEFDERTYKHSSYREELDRHYRRT